MEQNDKISIFFYRFGKKVVALRWIILAVLLVSTGLGFFGLTKIEGDNSIENWFFDSADIKKAQDNFEKIFGNSDYVGFLITADDVFDPEMLQLIRGLGKELEQNVEFVNDVFSLTTTEVTRTDEGDIIIEDLIPDPVPADRATIEEIRQLALSKDTLVDKLFTKNSKETWLVLRLLPFPDDWQKDYSDSPTNLVGFKILEILAQEKYKKYDIKATGMPLMAAEETLFVGTESSILTSVAMVVAIIILALFLRSVSGVIIPFLVSACSIIIVYGFMGLTGLKINILLASIPIFLSLAVSIGYSIHIYNFFKRFFMETGDRKESVAKAIEKTGWPILFTALTTIGGLVSFCAIFLEPIQWLGLTTAGLILTVFLLVITVTPSLLSFGKNRVIEKSGSVKAEKKSEKSDRFFEGLGNFVIKHPVPITLIFCAVVVFFTIGIFRLEVNMNTEATYGKRVPYINKMREVAKSDIGSFMSYDVAIDFGEADKIKDPVILKQVEEIIELIKGFESTKRINSVLSIIKDMHMLLNDNDPAFNVIPGTRELVAQLLLLYDMTGGSEASKWVDSNYSVLRIQVEVTDMQTKEIRETMAALKKICKEKFGDVPVTITGSMPQMAALNFFVSRGQVQSFIVAVLVIMVIMMLVFKSIKTGLIGLIPNITPVIIIGGLMGYFKVPLNFMTVTIIPMILGLAVDDTIHIIDHIRHEYLHSGNYKISILITLKTVGKSVFMTTFIIVAAFIIFLGSRINMMIHLGLFVVIGISSALLADYFMTPILIYWSKPFKTNVKVQQPVQNSEEISN